ncbi:hypothetical protein ARMGADRAFT_1040926 [Armillaria gallica]|uniref:Uncharacterized protein n=1 Tax=Armillaria gallica TaxID=47427 RepID=A0A2H3CRA9_ARMGA|nr:hypothetical protein ARMGADRAFT_1040926 [Armillaria gallica]
MTHIPGITANIHLRPEKNQHHQIYMDGCVKSFRQARLMISAHYNALRDQNNRREGHRAQEDPSTRIDGEGGGCDEVHHDDQWALRSCTARGIEKKDAPTLQNVPTTKAECEMGTTEYQFNHGRFQHCTTVLEQIHFEDAAEKRVLIWSRLTRRHLQWHEKGDRRTVIASGIVCLSSDFALCSEAATQAPSGTVNHANAKFSRPGPLV